MQRRELYSGSPINQTLSVVKEIDSELWRLKGEVKLCLNTPYFQVGQLFSKFSSGRNGWNLGKNIVIITTESTTLFINVPGNGSPYLADDAVN